MLLPVAGVKEISIVSTKGALSPPFFSCTVKNQLALVFTVGVEDVSSIEE
jgi:hypothetical protein